MHKTTRCPLVVKALPNEALCDLQGCEDNRSRAETPGSHTMSGNSSPEQPAVASSQDPNYCTPLPDFTFKQLLNVMLQCTFLYVESEIGLVDLDVFQVRVAQPGLV